MLNNVNYDSLGAAFLIPLAVSLILGLMFSCVHMYRNKFSKSFIGTLAVLPAIVCVVIMAVNGSIGTGVAIAGAFSLVRFRSAPGTAKEIAAVFAAMTAGLLTGMNYILYAVIFTMVIGGMIFIYQLTGFGDERSAGRRKSLRIMIPEDLDYTSVFDDLFRKYTESHELISSKTSNMGSMFKLTYEVVLKNDSDEKEFLDAVRCRNGNLEISISTLLQHEATEL